MVQLAIVLAYMVFIVLLGVAERKKIRGLDDFLVAGRKQSALWVAGSLVATIVGASATVGMAGLGFSQGLTGAWWLLVGTIGLVVGGLFLAGKVRSFAVYTLPQLMERQYDSRVAVAASVLIVIAWVGVVAAQIAAAGAILSVLGMGSPALWMTVFTAVFVGYAVLGGQHAVIRTDVIQAGIICAGVFPALFLLVSSLGGFADFLARVPPDKLSFPISAKFDASQLATYLLLVGLTYVVGPDIYSRLFCAKDERTARKSALLAAAVLVPLAFAITLTGLAASVAFPGITAERALPTVMTESLSPFWGGLVLAALVSALMSSADTTVLTASTIFSVDVVGRIAKPKTKKTLIMSRWGVVVVGAAALTVAMSLKGVISTLMFAYTVFTCGVIVPVLAGFYRERLKVTPTAALAAVVGGGATGLISKLFAIKYLDLGGMAMSALLLVAVSAIEHSRRR